ncbi:hypothetical protein OG440_38195 (plasmid) [Streptomyces sp. NBC_00637]|jgi:hypothetical protein|uniref:hypothetical protein n=1 Tax=Streptomyces sp. NBC_00637 TaxID=2903667 RepID=UPI002F907C93
MHTPATTLADHIARTRASLLAEWDGNARYYPFVTDGIAHDVLLYCALTGTTVPAGVLTDKDTVAHFVEAVRQA